VNKRGEGSFTSILDDYKHGFPILGELGDEPEKWLEPKGKGMVKLS